jgi:HPr kinase/phosphorylase
MITLSRFNKDNEKKLGLKLLTLKRTLARKINSSEILRPSYALNGHFENLSSGKVMLFDQTDMSFLSNLSKDERLTFFDKLFEAKVSCIIVSRSDTSVPEGVINKAKERNICMFRSDEPATKIIHIVSDYLDFTFAPIENVHGTLVDVWGIGILIVGRSGVGKSEVALDLVERGHRLVADDLVMCRRKNKFILMGEGREFADHYLEIRGVGLVDVKRLYGIRSVRVQKRIEVILELVDWDPKRNFDRIGIDQNYQIINEVKLPKVELPIFPGKNMTVLAETIALNQLLKVHGINPAKEFNDNLMKQMQKKMKERKQFDEFLDDDYE